MHVLQKEINHRPNVVDKHEIAKAKEPLLLFFDLSRVLLTLCIGFFEPVHAVIVFIDFFLQVEVDVDDSDLQ